MTSEIDLPPARERYRYGIPNFGENPAAATAHALFDRVSLRVGGVISIDTSDDLDQFAQHIGQNSPTGLFTRARREAGRWTAAQTPRTTISQAKVAIWKKADKPCQFDVKLTCNLNRTLGHLLDKYPYEHLVDLTPLDFFARRARPSATAVTLDGEDNMVTDFRAFSGSTAAVRLQRVAEYLDLFEQKLVRLLLDELCPPGLGFRVRRDGADWVAENERVRLRLDWSRLTVSQCEVCWEWYERQALERVHPLADLAFKAARSADVVFHEDGEVRRTLGATSIRVPMPGGLTLAIYAKAHDRLRFEVRYTDNLPDMVRDALPRAARTLVKWFEAIRHHAAQRVPWSVLSALREPSATPTVDTLADLVIAVADATEKARDIRPNILRQLLLHGAITATTATGTAPVSVLKRLADRGVIVHTRLISRDPAIGRRYTLSTKYSAIPTALAECPIMGR